MSDSPENHAYGVRPPQPSASPSATPEATYAVRAPGGPGVAAARAAAKKRIAIFVAHGMGQQIPFETLDQVAEGLRRQDPRWDADDPQSKPRPMAESVAVGDQVLQRVVLDLADKQGKLHEVHVYEGYWAPLTEGQVTLRDVIGFLFRAGLNGIKNGSQPFKRWLFDRYAAFPAPIRTVLYLLTALGMVASLVVLNTAIVLVSAARSPLQNLPAWLSDGLFADLTTTFNAYLFSLIPFAGLVVLGIALHGKKGLLLLRRILGYLSLFCFFFVALATILAGIAVPALFYGHIQWVSGKEEQIWPRVLRLRGGQVPVDAFNGLFETSIFWLLVVVAGLFLLLWISRIAMGVWRNIAPQGGTPEKGRWLTLLYALCFLVITFVVGYEIFRFVGWMLTLPKAQGRPWNLVRSGIAWPLLVLVGIFVRGVLIQYVGDVAAYVTSHTLDRFEELRQKIKSCVGNAARAVYARQEPDGGGYQQVIAVGHSLGSAVVYDTLNRLILEDNLAGPQGHGFLDVAKRTPLFLTFGSPLNKFAFLFALQAAKTTEAREALAAAAQPLLLENYRFRPERWINLYSPWDIISGSLTYYDLPGVDPKTQPKAVCNQTDPAASTFLAAHVQYWQGTLLFETLYRQVIGKPGPCVPS